MLNWKQIFVPGVPLLEIFLRGTIVYLSLFALLRLVLKREAGTLAITDLLVVVLIADAAQNAMAAEYHSVTEGLVLVATLVFWSYALDWLGYRYSGIRRFVHPPPLPLVKDGKMLRRNMRQELITEEELMSQCRQQGISDLCDVRAAYMEGDGHISVISREKEQHAKPERAAF